MYVPYYFHIVYPKLEYYLLNPKSHILIDYKSLLSAIRMFSKNLYKNKSFFTRFYITMSNILLMHIR